MAKSQLNELKKRLIHQGFEVYRTLETRIVFADRVRDNLIMDSGVALEPNGTHYVIHIQTRAQGADFPNEGPDMLFQRAREVAGEAQTRGYEEREAQVREVTDPGDKSRVLDTWYEVRFCHRVDENQLEEELRFALALGKTASR